MNPACVRAAARYRVAAAQAGVADAAFWQARRALLAVIDAPGAPPCDPRLLTRGQAVQDAYARQQQTARTFTLAEADLRYHLGLPSREDANGCE